MMEFGKSLRTAREAKGFTVQQLAEMTRMAPTMVDDLEREDFSHIAAPIYGRGFVKLYCEAVGLESKPFIDEFMEILNGNRDLQIKERAVEPEKEKPEASPVAAAAPDAAVPDVPQDPIPQQELFGVPNGEDRPAPDIKPEETAESENRLSRYATPFYDKPHFHLPSPTIWRMAALALCALALLALLIWGLRALHQATVGQKTSSEPTPSAPATPAAPAEQPPAPAAPRQQQAVPALYID